MLPQQVQGLNVRKLIVKRNKKNYPTFSLLQCATRVIIRPTRGADDRFPFYSPADKFFFWLIISLRFSEWTPAVHVKKVTITRYSLLVGISGNPFEYTSWYVRRWRSQRGSNRSRRVQDQSILREGKILLASRWLIAWDSRTRLGAVSAAPH